jgi:hypothetical protein
LTIARTLFEVGIKRRMDVIGGDLGRRTFRIGGEQMRCGLPFNGERDGALESGPIAVGHRAARSTRIRHIAGDDQQGSTYAPSIHFGEQLGVALPPHPRKIQNVVGFHRAQLTTKDGCAYISWRR